MTTSEPVVAAVGETITCPGCGESVTLDWADGWRNDAGFTCEPVNTTHSQHIDRHDQERPMTTSEQAAWAKAEAEKRWEGETIPQDSKPFVAADNAGFTAGVLHVLSLLESEPFVDAVQMRVYDDYRTGDTPVIRAALAAAMGAILAPGEKAQSADTNQETGGSES